MKIHSHPWGIFLNDLGNNEYRYEGSTSREPSNDGEGNDIQDMSKYDMFIITGYGWRGGRIGFKKENSGVGAQSKIPGEKGTIKDLNDRRDSDGEISIYNTNGKNIQNIKANEAESIINQTEY